MKKITKLSLLLAVAVATTWSATGYAQAEKGVFIRGIRPLGMGGAFVALADDQNAIFYNPAGLTQRRGGQLTFLELPLNISEDVMNFYNYFKDNEDKLQNFDTQNEITKIDILNEINDKIVTYKPNFRAGFPNTNYINGRWGFGVFNQAEIGCQFNRSLIIPSISFWGNVDVLAALPVAHRFNRIPFLPGGVSVGTTLKYIQRARIEEYNKSVLEFESFDPVLQWGKGFGADLGMIYHPNDRWNIGAQITDLGGTSMKFDTVKATKAGQIDKEGFTGTIKSKVNLGTAYVPSKIVYWPGRYINTLDRLVFACDVRDIASSEESLFEATFWKKLHMGAELRWGPMSVRGGFNSGYPAIGAGVRVPFLGLKADYAYWADETGRYAGQMPEWNHQLTFAFSWGDSKGRAYGNDASVKQPVTRNDDRKAAMKTKTPEAEAAPVVPESADGEMQDVTAVSDQTPQENSVSDQTAVPEEIEPEITDNGDSVNAISENVVEPLPDGQ